MRRFRRSADKLVAGVASGLGEHLGVPVLLVRLGFVALALYNGFGIALYLAYWAVVPQGEKVPRSRDERTGAAAYVAIGTATATALIWLAIHVDGRVLWPALLAVAGLVLVWRQADEPRRSRGRGGIMVIGVGLALLLAGLAWVLVTAAGGQRPGGRFALTMLALVAAAGVGWPWWRRLAADLGRERRARIRSQERAEVAAHLHDSVLQTLTLIQRQVDSPREVARLARRQERELRDWLYGLAAELPSTLAGMVRATADEVEDRYGVVVELVVVGDLPTGERVAALAQATREAMVNAAKHSGAGTVSAYVEVERHRVTVFVRDRGRGFDTALGGAGRHGLAESVHGRMERYGGRATVQSTPGEGTEVELELPC